MQLELSKKEFRRLLDMVYIGNWILNSTRGDDRIADYDQVESKLFALCRENGARVYLLGTGSIMAFPGSMCGALLAGLLYRCLPKLWMSCLGEIIGTGIISALLAWPIAIFILGTPSAPFAYVVPFMTAALVGVVIASVLMFLMNRSGALNAMRRLARGD